MSPLDAADWTFPVPIVYGPGRIEELPLLAARAGMRRPLLVTDRGSTQLPFIAAMMASLSRAGLDPALFAEISPNPNDHEVEAGRVAFEQSGRDGVIAVGGGSGMDGGKAISLVAGRGRPLWSFDFDLKPEGDGPAFVPVICVPTTSGTGAETESTAMVTDTARGIKGCVWHPEQKPRAALLDPNLTLGLPRNLTAWTGCDALTHAIEAFCVPSWHPLCDAASLEALRLIKGALPVAVRSPGDLEARGAMLVGSCLAGVGFLKGLGLVHAISHMVGAEYDTQHGLTNAILLPAVLRFNRDSIAGRVPLMCEALGLPDRTFPALETYVCDLMDSLEIPRGLAALGVRAEGAASLAAKAVKDPACLTNPRVTTEGEIEALIRSAVEEAR